jgi:hypothetical protein
MGVSCPRHPAVETWASLLRHRISLYRLWMSLLPSNLTRLSWAAGLVGGGDQDRGKAIVVMSVKEGARRCWLDVKQREKNIANAGWNVRRDSCGICGTWQAQVGVSVAPHPGSSQLVLSSLRFPSMLFWICSQYYLGLCISSATYCLWVLRDFILWGNLFSELWFLCL